MACGVTPSRRGWCLGGKDSHRDLSFQDMRERTGSMTAMVIAEVQIPRLPRFTQVPAIFRAERHMTVAFPTGMVGHMRVENFQEMKAIGSG
jgi:hypothetical protein